MKRPLAVPVLLVVLAGASVWMWATGGLSGAAQQRVGPGSDAAAGLISHGEPVDLAAHARASGRTVFLFTKPWCGGCWRLAPRVEEAVRAAGDATLRVIDIDSWESGVARQHGVTAAPELLLFVDGRPAERGVDAVMARLAP